MPFLKLTAIEDKQFAKGAFRFKGGLAVKVVKKQAFLKMYDENREVLEIKLSLNQLDALEDKYDTSIELETKEPPTIEYQIYMAATFMRRDKLLYAKLENLKLLRFCEAKYIK